MEAPFLFQCPISLELMDDPVTIATGVTYERKNIEKWLFTCKKLTCPATMQRLESFDLTPNLTLKRLISSFLEHAAAEEPVTSPPCSSDAVEHDKLVSLLKSIQTGPFKASGLRKLKVLVEKNDELQKDLIRSGGIEVLGCVMSHVVVENSDFTAFRACEEALGVLSLLPLSDDATVELVLKPDCLKPMMVILQRGSAEARVHAMSILTKISKINNEWITNMVTDQDVDIVKSLLDLLSDEISTKLSSSSLDVLLEIVATSNKNRLKAIEAGAVCILLELLPDASRHNCEKVLLLLRRLCECAEGRSAFADHGLGVAAVSKKILRVSEMATKLGVQILWLISSFHPREKLLEEMMVFGTVRKLLALLHIDGRSSSTNEKAIKMMKLHWAVWRQYPCFPSELKDFLRLNH
ncbi:hypothetical protein B296_00049453 [Ensete ventricosum]|uniref:U-box domain-containing protein n=1 Tax=Ensete ventricosum TaxID=4639 RepID=A0A426X9B7_ENSVE|nr:hypothetical protein B296_00049453 [Ensete ventricosum]